MSTERDGPEWANLCEVDTEVLVEIAINLVARRNEIRKTRSVTGFSTFFALIEDVYENFMQDHKDDRLGHWLHHDFVEDVERYCGSLAEDNFTP